MLKEVDAFSVEANVSKVLQVICSLNQYVTFYSPAQTNGADYKAGVIFFCKLGGMYFSKNSVF